jgi:hypothetical protein
MKLAAMGQRLAAQPSIQATPHADHAEPHPVISWQIYGTPRIQVWNRSGEALDEIA